MPIDPITKLTSRAVLPYASSPAAMGSGDGLNRASVANAGPPSEEPAAAHVTADLVPSYPSAFHALNPVTKFTSLVFVCAWCLLGPEPLGLAAAVLALMGGALASGTMDRILRTSVPVGIAIAVAVACLRAAQTFGTSDSAASTISFTLGAAGETLLRATAVAAAITLFAVTTDRRDAALDLERRGMPHGSAMALVGFVGAGPAIAHRYRLIEDAQRARGLPLDGGWLTRAGGQVPLFFPTLVSALHELGERSLARESRAVSRPGRRTLLWAPGERTWEPLIQVAAIAFTGAIIVARLVSWIR